MGAPPVRDGERLVAGRYRVTGHLGSGSVAHVLAAVDTASGRRVALKSARRHDDEGAAIALLRHEARLLAQLDGPRLPRLVELHDHDGETLLVTELVDGRVIGDGRRDWEDVRRIATDTAEALATLHAAGIVHCDVKPDNLIDAPSTGIVLLDLNVARATGSSTGGQFIGSAPYMAPELWTGDPVAPSTDVYALAALVMALATGAPLFSAATRIQWMRAHLDSRPRSASERGLRLPSVAEAALAAALAKRPADRPQQALELARAL